MTDNFVTLPDIYIVGGSSEELIFNILSKDSKPVNLAGRSVNFSISEYSTLSNSAVLSYSSSNNRNVSVTGSMIKVFIDSSDTKDLCGKYVYQITIENIPGEYVVYQGDMFIKKNRNASFIGGGLSDN